MYTPFSQVILRASAGMNFSDFSNFMSVIAKARICQLEKIFLEEADVHFEGQVGMLLGNITYSRRY